MNKDGVNVVILQTPSLDFIATLFNNYTTATQTPHNSHTTTTQQPHRHHTTATQPPHNSHTATTQQPHNHHTTATQPPHNSHTTTTQHPHRHHTTATQPPHTSAVIGNGGDVCVFVEVDGLVAAVVTCHVTLTTVYAQVLDVGGLGWVG